MSETRIEVVEIATGQVVKALNASGWSQLEVDRVVMGLLRQVDRERFFVRERAEVAP